MTCSIHNCPCRGHRRVHIQFRFHCRTWGKILRS
jgi:hypothetical protein